tara:strand:+ start:550 stop:684 length:135 start_codon:yes stop_codon:yes gene_type:complete
MNIDIKQASKIELLSYKIALMKVIIDCNEQLKKIKSKLENIKED